MKETMTRFETILNLSYTKCFTWIQVNQIYDRWKYTLPYQGSQRLLCFCCSPGWSGVSCALLCWQRRICVERSLGWHSYFSWANMTQDCVCHWKQIWMRVHFSLRSKPVQGEVEASSSSLSPPWWAFFSAAPEPMWCEKVITCDVMPLETGCHVQHNTHALFFFWPSSNRFHWVNLHIPGVAAPGITCCPDLDPILAWFALDVLFNNNNNKFYL